MPYNSSLKKKRCIVCGELFLPGSPIAKYCSDICKKCGKAKPREYAKIGSRRKLPKDYNRSLNMEKIAFIANFAVLKKSLSYGQLLYEIYKKEKEYL